MSTPLVTAVLVTGRAPRYWLARGSVQCFLRQTYPNKELLIINDGPESLSTGDPRIRELRFKRQKSVKLGGLRNLGLGEAMGEWVVQWDDDDWNDPRRLEWQMSQVSGDANAYFFRNQIRYSFVRNSAFVTSCDEGFHGTILHHRRCFHRYPNLPLEEDSVFKGCFAKQRSLDNPPELFVRLFHGRNVWDEQNIMGRLAGKHDTFELTAAQQDHVLTQVVPTYSRQ